MKGIPAHTLGAVDGNRTRTLLPELDFKSKVSTSSTTTAYWWFHSDLNGGQLGYEPRVLTN